MFAIASVVNLLLGDRLGLPILFLVVMAVVGEIGSAQINSTNNTKTNFMIVLADDMGWGDVNYNGGIARTPNINTLANSVHGIQFNKMYAYPVCSPSRALLYSGQYPLRNCVAGTTMYTTFKPPYNMQTIAMDAQQAGYRTAYFGKWHLGPIINDMIGMLGFDTWTASYGNLFAYDPTCFCEDLQCQATSLRYCSLNPKCYILGKNTCTAYATKNCSMGHMNRFTWLTTPPEENTRACDYMIRQENGTIIPARMPRGTIAAEYLGDRFQDFFESLNPSEPFLAVIAFTEVHIPYVGDPVGKLNSSLSHNLQYNAPRNDYVTCVENIDKVLGRVRQLIEESGRANHTLLIFLSDNGAESPRLGGAGSNSYLRDWKKSVFEGGVRVPGIFYWPAMIRSNVKFNEFTSLVDVRPTIREILMLENTALQFRQDLLDGESLLPLVRSPTTWNRSKDLLLCRPRLLSEPVSSTCSLYAFYRSGYKIVVERGREFILRNPQNYLFNLTVDNRERVNLKHQLPNIYFGMAIRARAAINDIFASFRKNRCAS